jgi:hypothetical protein
MSDKSDEVSTREAAHTIIEDIARCNGTFTDDLRREAEKEAKRGRRGMLQVMESCEETRKNLSKVLKM